MSQLKETVVRLQALDGGWEVCGVDRLRGIHPELEPLAANGWGPNTASFNLRRDPKAIWPDLGVWTPCEIEVGGVLVWDGRVKETPSRDGNDMLMSVHCEGWQYHLDDDLYERSYVHNNLADWKDIKSFLSAPVGFANAAITAINVSSGDGALTISCPVGAVWLNQGIGGAVLDLGPGNRATDAVLDVTGLSTGQGVWFIRGFNSLANLTVANDLIAGATINAGSFPNQGVGVSFPTPCRYVAVFIYNASGANYTVVGTDAGLKITGARVFTSTSYKSGGSSVLRAPTVIFDALDQATDLLSTDRSEIDPAGTVSFNIPSFAPGEPRSPREMWEAVNAYHNYSSKIEVGRVPSFKPLPASPIYEVGPWSSFEFNDLAAGSGPDIYNQVWVTAQGPDGSLVRVRRSTPGTNFAWRADVQASNPSFDTNTAGWGGSTIARETSVFASGPASLKVSAPGGAPFVSMNSWSTAFREGGTYQLRIPIRRTAAVTLMNFALYDGAPGINTYFSGAPSISLFPVGQFAMWESPPFTVQPGAGIPYLEISFIGSPTTVGTVYAYIDDIEVAVARPTMVDRRGFVHSKVLQIRSPLPSDGVAASQIGDTWLQAHRTTPFKGNLTISGDDSVREVLTGRTVPLERLLLATDELLRFSDRVDPDTGGWGRDGRMTEVSYDPAKNEATVTLDSARNNFEALLERLAVVTGGS